jgi:hypothetical protein
MRNETEMLVNKEEEMQKPKMRLLLAMLRLCDENR